MAAASCSSEHRRVRVGFAGSNCGDGGGGRGGRGGGNGSSGAPDGFHGGGGGGGSGVALSGANVVQQVGLNAGATGWADSGNGVGVSVAGDPGRCGGHGRVVIRY